MTGQGSRRPPRPPKKPKGFDDVPVLSPEEVERRVDMRGGPTPDVSELPPPDVEPGVEPRSGASAHDLDDLWIRSGWVPADPVVPGPVTTPTPRDDVADERADDRRRILWRDSATILIGVIVAILAAQAFLPAASGGPEGSATPFPSGVAVGTLPPPVTIPPGDTFGPIIDPSLGVDATPTPIPVITLGPPTPSPSPSADPSASLKPSPKPTPKPTPRPTRTPTPPPPPTPPPTPPPPAVAWSWDPSEPSIGQPVQFDSTASNVDSYSWDFDDGATSSGADPTHTFLTERTYNVTLTVTGPGGTDVVAHNVVVTLLPPP